jgi:tetratricopeptide (TPR) repeat protein
LDFPKGSLYFSRMPEKSAAEIPRDLRELYQKGVTAVQRQNLDYAIAIFQQVVQREPAFLEGRQALRAAQIKKVGTSTGFFKKMLGGATSSPLMAKAQMAKGKNPLEAVQIAEQILEGDPHNSIGHKILAESALAGGLPRTACFAYEILLKASPRDYDLSMAYGEALAAAGQVAKAEQVYQELQRSFPNKAEISMALKDLAAKRTLNEGGYEALAGGGGSYRDILKDKTEAVRLEQENRVVKNEDDSARLIREYEARLVAEPRNVKLLRNIAEIYAQQKNYDRSIEFYERIRGTEAGADPSLEKAISDLVLKRFDYNASLLDASDPAQAEQIDQLRRERAAFQIEDTRKRAEKYPTDLLIKFELGVLYLQAGKVSEAIQEFQKAQGNPNKRLSSMMYLAQCFSARNMNDLAARKLKEALKEKPAFDEEKKEMVYQLGCVLEKMNKKEEAIEQFKQIYETDIGYKDVAAKVDAYYSSQG